MIGIVPWKMTKSWLDRLDDREIRNSIVALNGNSGLHLSQYVKVEPTAFVLHVLMLLQAGQHVSPASDSSCIQAVAQLVGIASELS